MRTKPIRNTLRDTAHSQTVGFKIIRNLSKNSSTSLLSAPRLSAVRQQIKIKKLTKLACVSFFVLNTWSERTAHCIYKTGVKRKTEG
jgi:hypothetical protein